MEHPSPFPAQRDTAGETLQALQTGSRESPKTDQSQPPPALAASDRCLYELSHDVPPAFASPSPSPITLRTRTRTKTKSPKSPDPPFTHPSIHSFIHPLTHPSAALHSVCHSLSLTACFPLCCGPAPFHPLATRTLPTPALESLHALVTCT